MPATIYGPGMDMELERAHVLGALVNKFQAAEIFFDDDTCTANPERVRQLSREFRPLQFTWSATARVNTDYKSLKAMKEGTLDLCIGTHALLGVEFKNLALLILMKGKILNWYVLCREVESWIS